MESLKLVLEKALPSEYSIFRSVPLQNFHLGKSRLLKKCIFTLLGSDRLHSHPRKPRHERKKLTRMRMSILQAVTSTLAAMERKWSLSGLRINVSLRESSLHLNAFGFDIGFRGLLDGKADRALKIIFAFVCGFLDRVTGYT